MPASSLIGKSNRELVSELEGKIKYVFDTGQATTNYTQHEFPEGTAYFYMKLIPEFLNKEEQKGSVKSVWAMIREITQLKKTEIFLEEARKDLQKQNRELNQVNAELDTFLYDCP